MSLEIEAKPKETSPKLLKLAIIHALLSAPNHSYRYNKISDLVIKCLRIRTHGAPRNELKNKIMHEVRSLVRKNILKKYNHNTEFPRLKLTDSHSGYLKKLQNSVVTTVYGQQQIFPQIEQNSLNVEKSSDDGSDSIYIPDLPDIPESLGLEDQSCDPDLVENTGHLDEDTIELIDLLTEPSSNLIDSNKNQIYQRKDDLSATDILSLVRNEYENKEDIIIKQTYRELQLFFPVGNKSIYVLFTHRPFQKMAIITGYVPFIEGTTETVLRKYSGFDGTAMLCIENLGNQEFYAIRQRLELQRYTENEVAGMVAEVVLQAKRLMEIINGIGIL